MTELTREPLSLSSQQFDVLVIGGGINGAAVAWDSALRGFKTAIIDKGDFGAAASAGCFKIVHGGLRYLQHLDFRRVRESVEEQRTLRIIAPHLVHPFPFLIPCYGYGMKSRGALKAGLCLYDLLHAGRNEGVDSYHHLPRHRLISREEVLQIAPGLCRRGLSGGMIFYDCQMSNCERLTWSVVRSAVDAGALACNYSEAVKFSASENTESPERIDSVTVRDCIDGRQYRIRAKVVVNAAGPWEQIIRRMLDPIVTGSSTANGQELVFSKGIQLVTSQFIHGFGVAVESRYADPGAIVSRGKRSFFIHPWRGHSLVGTSDTVFTGDPDSYSVSVEEIRSLLADVRAAYQSDFLDANHVRFVFGGLRPVEPEEAERLRGSGGESSGEAKVMRHDEIVDHAQCDPARQERRIENLVSVVGVKYTTFRALAEKVVDRLSTKLVGRTLPCITSITPLYGGAIDDYKDFESTQFVKRPELSKNVIRSLAANYGSKVNEVYAILDQRSELAQPVAADSDVLLAEIVYSVRSEMAVRLADVVLRRTGLGTLGFPGEEVLGKAAALMGRELAWDKAQIEQELRTVNDLFAVVRSVEK